MTTTGDGVIHARWVPTQAEFDRFAEISGDDNPIHVDPDFSDRTRFGRTVSHGMLLYSRVWALIRDRFPDMRPVEQSLMFPNPSYADEALSIVVAPSVDDPTRLSMVITRESDGAETLTGTCVLEGDTQ